MPLLLWLRNRFSEYEPGLGVALPWIGAAVLALAMGVALHSWNGVRFLVKTTATVTENVSGFAAKGGVLYYPRLRFRETNGELDRVLLRQGSEEAEFATGDNVPVRYPVGHPDAAFIATRWRVYHAGISIAILGVILVDLGLLFQYQSRRQARAVE